MKLLVALLLLLAVHLHAQTYTEFYCNSTGTNINAGSTTNATPTLSDTSGNWTNATQTYQFSGATDLSAITNGMWASVFANGATTAAYIGRISAVNDAADFVTVSNISASGIAPSDGTGNRSLRIGGAWYGPWYSGATVDNMPLTFVNAQMTNTSLGPPRVNIKADRLYSVTNITMTSNGPMRFEGWTNTPGDNGIALISGSAVGSAHVLMTLNGANCEFANLHFSTNGASGNGNVINANGVEQTFYRCVFSHGRQSGIGMAGNSQFAIECEAFSCNKAASSAHGGFLNSGIGNIMVRCFSHDNTNNTQGAGFIMSGYVAMINCIAINNGRDGALLSGGNGVVVSGCDFYNNASNGVSIAVNSAASTLIENSNFAKNGTYGINSLLSIARSGQILNCGFGSGTMANGSGTINTAAMPGVQVAGTVTYAADASPWVNAGTGNFSITLASAINAGRGQFLQTDSAYSGTIGYPDIGAAQTTNSAAVGGGSESRIILRR